jgi:hypothetical protein
MMGLLLRFFIIAVPGTVLPALGQQTKDAAETPIATAQIITESFCRGTPAGLFIARGLAADAISLDLHIRVSLRNEGTVPLIVLRREDKRVVLSRSLQDASRYESQLVFPYYEFLVPQRPYIPEDLPFIAAERPGTDFEVIPPSGVRTDGAFALSFQVHKPSVNDAGSETGSELLGKTFFFQVELDHAFLPESVERGLKAKWGPIGTLWAGKVRTQPIEISIPPSPLASQCASNIRIE